MTGPPPGKVYEASRDERLEPHVWVLATADARWRLGPPGRTSGPEWAVGEFGPRLLAVELLRDATGEQQLAEALHEHFAAQVVAALPATGWTLTQAQVRDWVRRHQHDHEEDGDRDRDRDGDGRHGDDHRGQS